MADHYYTESPTSPHDERLLKLEILGHALNIVTDAGVFSRDGLDTGTRALIRALPPLTGRVLDLGCGWGAVGLALGRAFPALQIVMTDINRRAVDLARRNLAANGVRAEVVQGDGFEAVHGPFDAIITNPPIRAGKAVIHGLFATAREYLAPGGSLYLVMRKQQGAPSALKYLKEIYAEAEIIDRSAGYHVIRAAMKQPGIRD